jgi:hypothetical protein
MSNLYRPDNNGLSLQQYTTRSIHCVSAGRRHLRGFEAGLDVIGTGV